MEKGAKPQNKGGKGKGGSTQRNLGKRKSGTDTSKLPCHNWSRGRYSHDGPKGGGTTSTTMAVTNKRIKKGKE
jgi:hypothetical protein